jgi:hypothetical protein
MVGRYFQAQDKTTRWAFKGDKYRYDLTESSATIRNIPDWAHQIYWYDGTTARTFTPNAKEGSVRAKDDMAHGYNDPRQFGFFYTRHQTLADFLEKAQNEGKLHLLRTEPGAAGPIHVLQYETGKDQFQQLSFDAARGFLLTKKEVLSKSTGSQPVARDMVIEAAHYAPGLWFPVRWRSTAINRAGVEWMKIEGQLREFQPNVAVPDSEFQIRFPVGTRVSDFHTNRVYFTNTFWGSFRRSLSALGMLIGFIMFRRWRRSTSRDMVPAR